MHSAAGTGFGGYKWDNNTPYCGQLPALEKIETEWCETGL